MTKASKVSANTAVALIGLGETSNLPKAGDIREADFEGTTVRGRFYKKEWWLSIVDVIAALGAPAHATVRLLD